MVDVRLLGKGNSKSQGSRPVHQIISMIKWIGTGKLSIKNSLSSVVQHRVIFTLHSRTFLAKMAIRDEPSRASNALRVHPSTILPKTSTASTKSGQFTGRRTRSEPIHHCTDAGSSSSSLLLSSLELSDTKVYEP